MFDMWDKHIEPKIQANMTHKAVPDKKRWTPETVHDLEALKNAPPSEIPEEFQERIKEMAMDPKNSIPFNANRKKFNN